MCHEGSRPQETVVASARLKNTFPRQRIHKHNNRGTNIILVMGLVVTEATNDCAGEDHQQFNGPTDRPTMAEKTYCVL
jgi:hypothetical protein